MGYKGNEVIEMTVFVNIMAIGITACILIPILGICFLVTVDTIKRYRRKK